MNILAKSSHILEKVTPGFHLKKRYWTLVTGDYVIWDIPEMLECWLWQKIHKSTVILTGLLNCQAFCSRRYVFHLPLDKCALLRVTQSLALLAWEVLTPEDFSPGYLCVLFKVALKDIVPFYLNHLFFKMIFPSTYTCLEYDVLCGKRITFTTEKKKSVSYITLPYRLEDMSEANGNKWLIKINFEHFPT